MNFFCFVFVFTQADITCSSTKQSIGVIFTRTNFVTLKYVTDSWGTRVNGFRLIITAFKDPCKYFYFYFLQRTSVWEYEGERDRPRERERERDLKPHAPMHLYPITIKQRHTSPFCVHHSTTHPRTGTYIKYRCQALSRRILVTALFVTYIAHTPT